MASELFKGQDFRLVLNTGIDLTGASVLKILTFSPTGIKAAWDATWDGVTSKIFHDVTNTENNQAGDWQFQAYVEIAGKKYYGQVVRKQILKNIDAVLV